MVDAWPNGLPQCPVRGYSTALADGRLAYTPDQGPAIVRQRSTAMTRPLSGQIKLDRRQLGIFRAFFDVTLSGGSLPFSWRDPLDGSEALIRFAQGKVPGIVEINGNTFRVSLDLEILP